MVRSVLYLLPVVCSLAQPESFAPPQSLVPPSAGQIPGQPSSTGVFGAVPGQRPFPSGGNLTGPAPNQFNGGGNPLPMKKRSAEESASAEDQAVAGGAASLPPAASTTSRIPVMKRAAGTGANVPQVAKAENLAGQINGTTTAAPTGGR